MQQATIVVVGTFAQGYERSFKEYSGKVRAFLEAHDATVVRRQLVERTLYGGPTPSLVMLIDFPSKESAGSAFFEKEYLDLIPLRDTIFSDFQMFLANYGEV